VAEIVAAAAVTGAAEITAAVVAVAATGATTTTATGMTRDAMTAPEGTKLLIHRHYFIGILSILRYRLIVDIIINQ
jgi:hypothetical protein